MTQSTTFAEQQGSTPSRFAREQTLAQAIKFHLDNEKVSFHTPGHKGRFQLSEQLSGLQTPFAADLTELPGLDQLSEAESVLKRLQERLAALFSARETYISVNGASAALTAAIMSCTKRGKKVLLPRDVHRSALNACILSGLEPLFYESPFLADWQISAPASAAQVEQVIRLHSQDLAAVVLCSPNYAGLLGNFNSVFKLCKERKVMSIVDEAHAAHSVFSPQFQASALNCGADLVVHSLHKTLCAPTQTGLLHASQGAAIEPGELASFLSMLQSSSPSYLLMMGIERALESDLAGVEIAQRTVALAARLRAYLAEHHNWVLLDQAVDPLHILFKHKRIDSAALNEYLQSCGVFVETVLGTGLLLLLGFGSNQQDIDYLISCLENVETSLPHITPKEGKPDSCHFQHAAKKQLMDPRKAFFSKSEMVDATEAGGRIAAENYAPCPPGWAVLLAGQEIDSSVQQIVSANRKVRVVSSPFEGDSDGSNTPS